MLRDNLHLSDEARAAIVQLAGAYRCARQSQADPWEFALTLSALIQQGATESELRRLVLNGLVEHAQETTTLRNKTRRFRTSGNLRFTAETCFVLSGEGARLLDDVSGLSVVAPAEAGRDSPVLGLQVASCDGPCWDRRLRVLRFGDEVVKCFHRPAANQETVLAAFDEEGWPERILDPLPPRGELNPKRRLNLTIYRLNAHQQNRRIHFFGDGSGQGIGWQPLPAGISAGCAKVKLRRAA